MTTLQAILTGLDVRTLLVCCVVFIVIAWLSQRHLNWNKNLPPGPRNWPIVGCAPEFLMKGLSVHEFFTFLLETYGPVCLLPAPFGTKVVVVSGYEAVSETLTSTTFAGRPPLPNTSDDPIMGGLGVLMSTGEVWREQRRFSLTVLRGLGVGKRSFEDQIATEAEYLMNAVQSFGENSFDPTHLLCNAVSNVICSVVMGNRFDYDDPEFKQLLQWVKDAFSNPAATQLCLYIPILQKIPYFPQGAIPSSYALQKRLNSIVNEHRSTIDTEHLRDFIDVYIKDMDAKKEQGIETCMSNVELGALVRDFFLAGTETTSSTLRWAFLYMLYFTDVQRRVQEELDNVVGRNRLPKLSDKPNLPYTVACIHEIQRYASIIHMTGPRYATEDTEFRGFTIPKGSYIFPNLFSVTRESSIWESPDEFKPERFLDETGRVVKIPEGIIFGTGKRACLGEQLARMELYIFFTHMMHRFSFRKPAGDDTSLNIRPKSEAVLIPFPYKCCAITRT